MGDRQRFAVQMNNTEYIGESVISFQSRVASVYFDPESKDTGEPGTAEELPVFDPRPFDLNFQRLL
jgi:hypothetical protein